MHTYDCYAMRNKTEITTARTNHVLFNVQNIYVLGRRRHRWEDKVKMDRTALRRGVRALDSSGFGQAQLMFSCKHCNKLSISKKCSEFVNWIWNYLLFENNFLSWIY
jgi:hypothetical protein